MRKLAVERFIELLEHAEAKALAEKTNWGRNDLRLELRTVLAEAKTKALGRLNDELRQQLKERDG